MPCMRMPGGVGGPLSPPNSLEQIGLHGLDADAGAFGREIERGTGDAFGRERSCAGRGLPGT